MHEAVSRNISSTNIVVTGIVWCEGSLLYFEWGIKHEFLCCVFKIPTDKLAVEVKYMYTIMNLQIDIGNKSFVCHDTCASYAL